MRRFIVIGIFIVASAANLAKPIKIQFWNAMGGGQTPVTNHIISAFNHSQDQYKIINVYKGDYNTLLTSLVAAYHAHQQPAIAQIFEIGTATMIASRQAIVPVQTLMQRYGYSLTPRSFLPAIGEYYSDQGKLMSLPFNASSPVLYYNKAAFKKAGLDPNKPPKTWTALAKDGKKLLAAGYRCAYTTAWPAWIQLEVFSAWHNVAYANQDNGFSGIATRALYNNSLMIKQVKALHLWQKQHIFMYGGRGDNSESLFTTGMCAMLTQSSGSYGSLKISVNFPVGVGPLPYWQSVKGAPQNTIIGGASLWVMAGKKPKVYKGVAAFFHFLLKPSIQLYWQKKTGYLPLTIDGYRYALKHHYYQNNPGALVAIKELTNKKPTAYSRGIRLGNFMQIRDVNDTALEEVFSGEKTAKQALNDAAKRADQLLKRFKEINGGSA